MPVAINPKRFGQLGLAFAALLFFTPLVTNGYTQYVVNLVLVYVTIGIGLNLLLGYAGQFAFASAAFMAIGAYTAALLADRLHAPFWICLPAAGLSAAVIGALCTFPAMRMKAIYLGLATFAFAELTVWVLLHWESLTAGSNGVLVPPPSFFGWQATSNTSVFYVILVTTLIMYAAAKWIVRSRLGRAFVAIRENEIVAQCSGVNIARTKLLAFALSAFYAGIGGALYAITVGFVVPSSFGLSQLVLHLAIVVLGGVMSLSGSIIGAILLTALPEVLRDFQGLQEVIYGVVLVSVVLFMPSGVAGLLRKLGLLRREPFMKPLARPAVAASPAAANAGPRPAPGEPALIVEDIGVQFGGLRAVDGASLTLRKARISGLIGPNGAGKSTLFNAITGLTPLNGGKITLKGRDVTEMSAPSRAIAGLRRTFQSVQLIPDLTALENVLVGLHHRPKRDWRDALNPLQARRGEAAAQAAAHDALEMLGIAAIAHEPVHALTFAQQRLVEIARAVVAQPDVLMLDEPAAGLSKIEVEALDAVLRQLCRERGIAILLVEHDLGLVLGMSEEITVLDNGRQIAQGTPRDIESDPKVRTAYVGED